MKDNPVFNGKCITCKRPMHLISVKDALRQKPLRDLRKEFIREDRNFLVESQIKEETKKQVIDSVLKIIDERINTIKMIDENDKIGYAIIINLQKIKEKLEGVGNVTLKNSK